MLYITTKDQKDAHTAHKTLMSDCATDGGLYIPMRLPAYTAEEILKLKERSFSDVVAQILNYFFSARLTAWDVDFAIGRNPLKTVSLGRKIVISELWHNPDAAYKGLEKNLFRRLSQNGGIAAVPTDWARIAIRIAVLFGVYGELRRNGIVIANQKFDLAVDIGEYFVPVAAVYAKEMGLPIGKILCCCSSENGVVWDLIHRNDMSTATLTPQLRLGLERLLYVLYGEGELHRFTEACDKKRIYSVEEENQEKLTELLFCVVVGHERLDSVVNSVYRTDNYLIDMNTALPFGAIQDYRSKAGETTVTLLFSERDPAASAQAIMKATGMNRDAFYKLIK